MLTLLTFAALVSQTSPPVAEPPAQERNVVFVQTTGDRSGVDRDGDGQVTREEFNAPLDRAFARLDKDGDGRLSAEELRASAPGDDVMVLGDHGPGAHRFTLRRGGQGDERIEDIRIERSGDGPGPIILRRPGARDITVHTDGSASGRFEVTHPDGGANDMDKDGDGKVSEGEFLAPLREAFARMDADRSGFLEDGERGGQNQVHVFSRRIERDRSEAE